MEFGEFLNSLSFTDPVTSCFNIQHNLKLYLICFSFKIYLKEILLEDNCLTVVNTCIWNLKKWY